MRAPVLRFTVAALAPATQPAPVSPQHFRSGLGGPARTWLMMAIVTFAHLYPYPYHPAVNNPNENVRFFMTAAIVEQGSYQIDEMRARWGWCNDAATYDGHFFSVKAPGSSFLGVPGYALYYAWTRQVGAPVNRTTALWWTRLSGSILPSLLFWFFFYRWLARRGGSPVVRDAIFLSLAIGSPLYAYGMMFVSHTLSAAAAFGAFMILFDARRRGSLGAGEAFVAGACASAVTAFEYPGFVCSAVLCFYALYALRPWKRLVPFSLGALIPVAGVLHFHWRAYGNPLTPGHRYLEHAPFREAMEEGFFGASEWSWDAAGGLLFDPGYGVFWLTPVLLLMFVGYVALLRRAGAGRDDVRLDGLFALLVPLSLYLLICLMNNWRGGWTVGARYLAACLPFFGWAALEGFRSLSRRLPRTAESIAVGGFAVSLLACGGPSAWYPHIPENVTRPLVQMMRPLVRWDFAPMNVGSYLVSTLGLGELSGSRSMLPLALVALFAVFAVAWAERDGWNRALVLTGGMFVCSWIVTPLIAEDPAHTTAARDAMSYVTRYWTPGGHDVPARLEPRVREGTASERDLERLRDAYDEIGRVADAARISRMLAERERHAAAH